MWYIMVYIVGVIIGFLIAALLAMAGHSSRCEECSYRDYSFEVRER